MRGGPKRLGGGRVFADHYQFVLCETPDRPIADSEIWTDASQLRGFAGAVDWRMIGTVADLNDHWIDLTLAAEPPDLADWHRVVCCDFETASGAVHVMGLMDADPVISARVPSGSYAAFICVLNPGVDQQTTGEMDAGVDAPTDGELAIRMDLERYEVVLVPGTPIRCGILVDVVSDTESSDV